ncbi:hypothetical protein L9F63_001591, partial [Diploptera punctata]
NVVFVMLSCKRCDKRYDTIFVVQVRNPVLSSRNGYRRNETSEIGSLRGFYLFESERIHKRSLSASAEQHSALSSEPK